jgi:hypothetical protein
MKTLILLQDMTNISVEGEEIPKKNKAQKYQHLKVPK